MLRGTNTEAEFPFGCVQRTVETDLPREIDYLKCRDQALAAVMNLVEMSDSMAQDLILHIRQNGGSLSNAAAPVGLRSCARAKSVRSRRLSLVRRPNQNHRIKPATPWLAIVRESQKARAGWAAMVALRIESR